MRGIRRYALILSLTLESADARGCGCGRRSLAYRSVTLSTLRTPPIRADDAGVGFSQNEKLVDSVAYL